MSDHAAVIILVAYLRAVRYALACRLISRHRAMRLTSWFFDDPRQRDMPDQA